MLQVRPATLRDAPSVTEQPKMTMMQWRVLELSDGAKVLAGMLIDQPTLRIATAIVAHESSRFMTSSGRAYTLLGAPCSDPDVLVCIAQQLALLGDSVKRDLTEEYWSTIQAGSDAGPPDSHG